MKFYANNIEVKVKEGPIVKNNVRYQEVYDEWNVDCLQNNLPVLFYNSSNIVKNKVLKKKGLTLIKTKLDSKGLLDLKIVLKKLFTLGTRSLLVEGGDKISKNLIKNRLIDTFYLFQSLKNLKINKMNQRFTSFGILNDKYKKISKITSKLAKDNITIYKRKNV